MPLVLDVKITSYVTAVFLSQFTVFNILSEDLFLGFKCDSGKDAYTTVGF